ELPPNVLEQSHESLVITLGQHAALTANQHDILTLNAMLPKQSTSDRSLCILAKCPHSKSHYAIYLDQPVTRQLNLITMILPHIKSIGVLTAEFSAVKLDTLRLEARLRNLKIINRTVTSVSELHKQLNELIVESDVLLALPDPVIHNRETVPYLLLTSYRYNVPVIGFSNAYVNAGAIAAVFSSPQQIARQIRELSENILVNKPEQKVYSPKYFSVTLNKNVARSLELRLADPEQIKLKLLIMEK
ncbi:MAG: ABC transporter substrate-binding protein, partial [Gammaproteobacteria bacterium]